MRLYLFDLTLIDYAKSNLLSDFRPEKERERKRKRERERERDQESLRKGKRGTVSRKLTYSNSYIHERWVVVVFLQKFFLSFFRSIICGMSALQAIHSFAYSSVIAFIQLSHFRLKL